MSKKPILEWKSPCVGHEPTAVVGDVFELHAFRTEEPGHFDIEITTATSGDFVKEAEVLADNIDHARRKVEITLMKDLRAMITDLQSPRKKNRR